MASVAVRQALAREALKGESCVHCDEDFDLEEGICVFTVGSLTDEPDKELRFEPEEGYEPLLMHDWCWDSIRRDQHESCLDRSTTGRGPGECSICKQRIRLLTIFGQVDCGKVALSKRFPIIEGAVEDPLVTFVSDQTPLIVCYECLCEINEDSSTFWDEFNSNEEEEEDEPDE